ncbi:hypothetical protein Tco_0522719 [Tanacetum coccineum]
MAQPQRLADVHQDELCPPNKCYALMDSNKKIDLDNPLIFHPPQATDNNHERFVAAPKFSEMVPFFLNTLGFNLELRSPSNFKTTGLVQPWQTLGNTFARCLTTRVTGHDQPPLQIMQIARDKYYNFEEDVMVKNIFNLGKHKDGVRMKIPNTIQLSLAEYKSHDDLEAKQNVQKVEEHLIAEEIEKLVEGAENVENLEVNSSTVRQDDTQTIPGTRLELWSDKESPEVEITAEVQPININKEEEESAEDDYKLKRREKGKHVEESRITPSPTTIRSPRTHSNLISLDTKKL